jgi:uncharacterized DUF497 family protein
VTSEEDRPEIERLVWDVWNTEHIATHAVARNEVEEAVSSDTVARATYKNRFLVLGWTRSGRLLAVVIGPVPGQPGAYYTFSARPASRSERRFYLDSKRGDE